MFKKNLNDSSYLSFSNKFKVAVLGNANSGKTSIIRRIADYSNYTTESKYVPTIGVDYNTKVFRREKDYYKIVFWDLAGDKRFHGILPAYYRDNDLIMICLDCSKNVIHQASFWLRQIKSKLNKLPPILFVLNKSDLINPMYININDAIYSLDNFINSQLYNYKIIHQNHFIFRTSRNYIENKLINMLLENNLTTIDSDIDQAMDGWRLKRLPRIDRDILRLAYVDINFLSTPIAVACDEAVNLANKYSDIQGRKFINGVLRRLQTVKLQ